MRSGWLEVTLADVLLRPISTSAGRRPLRRPARVNVSRLLLAASLVPAAFLLAPSTVAVRFRVLAPAGDVRLVAPGGAEAAISGCSGILSMGSSTVFPNPHATVDRENHADAACAPFTVGEDTYALFMPPTTTPPETAEPKVDRSDRVARPPGELDQDPVVHVAAIERQEVERHKGLTPRALRSGET
jgi:hypothetical protein